MHDDPRERQRPSVRRTVATFTGALVLVLPVASCTGDDPSGAGDETPTPTEGSTTTFEPRPAPAVVRVTRVAGEMRRKDREVVATKVGRVVSGYFDDAFLGGDYPRASFGDAFATFTPGAARSARQHRALLTNALLGPTTESVVPRRQTAYLSVLAPHRVAAGVTARVDLRYLAERGDRPDQLVTVKGRLTLTRGDDGRWRIFGYDLTRAATAAEEGTS